MISLISEKLLSKIDTISSSVSIYGILNLFDNPNNSFQKIVELNAGAAIYIAGLTNSIKDGFEKAHQLIENRKTKDFYKNLVK